MSKTSTTADDDAPASPTTRLSATAETTHGNVPRPGFCTARRCATRVAPPTPTCPPEMSHLSLRGGGADAPTRDVEDVVDDARGRVHSIETFTAVDGYGIRCVVFAQGCEKRCAFCCNVDSQSRDARAGASLRRPGAHACMHCTSRPSFSLVASFSLFHAVGRHDLLFHRSRPIGDPLCRPRPALDLDLGWTRGTCAIITSHDSSWSRLCTHRREYSRRAVSFHSFHSIHFMHSFIPLEVSVGRRRVRRRSSMSSISSRRRTATGRDDRPARSSAVMGLSRHACLSLSSCLSLAMSLSRSRARARHRRRVRVLLSVLERVLERAHASTHARTNARIHPFMHPFMHPRIIGADIATTSRMDLEGCATRDVVTRRRRASRDARERGERERREVSISESRDRRGGRTDGDAATSIRFDSISSFDFDLI